MVLASKRNKCMVDGHMLVDSRQSATKPPLVNDKKQEPLIKSEIKSAVSNIQEISKKCKISRNMSTQHNLQAVLPNSNLKVFPRSTKISETLEVFLKNNRVQHSQGKDLISSDLEKFSSIRQDALLSGDNLAVRLIDWLLKHFQFTNDQVVPVQLCTIEIPIISKFLTTGNKIDWHKTCPTKILLIIESVFHTCSGSSPNDVQILHRLGDLERSIMMTDMWVDLSLKSKILNNFKIFQVSKKKTRNIEKGVQRLSFAERSKEIEQVLDNLAMPRVQSKEKYVDLGDFIHRKILIHSMIIMEKFMSRLGCKNVNIKNCSWSLLMALLSDVRGTVGLESPFDLLFSSSLISIITCIKYTVCKLVGEARSFAKLIDAMQAIRPKFAIREEHWFRHVGDGDLVLFYNTRFLPSMRGHIYRIVGSNINHIINGGEFGIRSNILEPGTTEGSSGAENKEHPTPNRGDHISTFPRDMSKFVCLDGGKLVSRVISTRSSFGSIRTLKFCFGSGGLLRAPST